MLDDFVNLIYSWGHRYFIEAGVTVVVFVLLHFVGYPFIIRRHDSLAHQGTPSISSGNITTYGDNSPVSVGTEDQRVESETHAKTSR